MEYNVNYNIDNNIVFSPDAICKCQSVFDDDGNVVRVMSDIEFILHNESHRKYDIPASVLRDYLDRAQSVDLTQSFNHHKFSDEQLVTALIPKDIGTITDAYQFSKYLSEHHQSIKQKIDNFVKSIKNK